MKSNEEELYKKRLSKCQKNLKHTKSILTKIIQQLYLFEFELIKSHQESIKALAHLQLKTGMHDCNIQTLIQGQAKALKTFFGSKNLITIHLNKLTAATKKTTALKKNQK